MAPRTLRVAMAQLDFPVGDIAGNARRIVRAADRARTEFEADVIVFPELALTGYPPEDLLLRPGFLEDVDDALDRVTAEVGDVTVVVGHTYVTGTRVCNAASVIRNGHREGPYIKHALPNYTVFDEKRYFSEGEDPLVVELGGIRTGVLVCEDTWEPLPARKAAEAGAELLIVINASPFHLGQREAREEALCRRFRDTQLMVVYTNTVGGQDDLVFDGRSCVVDGSGRVSLRAPAFEEGLFIVELDVGSGCADPVRWTPTDIDDDELLYRALVTGLRDYAGKNGFDSVLLGLSGGIDSALTLLLAVDALGAEHVHAVMLPSRHTSTMSLEDAEAMARNLNVRYSVISIDEVYSKLLGALQNEFRGRQPGVTEENLQARCRGTVLMALSNKFGSLLLATSNKSETAVGYTTLYGDMCGGFSPIKDVYKTLVYRLVRYRNGRSHAVPERILDRPPSAELAPDQTDQDSLPPYEELDKVLERYVEHDESIEQIIEAGFDADMVRRVAHMVLNSEYKRRQSAPGTRITRRAFGRDRRYPMTSRWRG